MIHTPGMISTRPAAPPRWRGRLADLVLAALLLGPLAAPFLYGWDALVPRGVAGVIYTMGSFVCPQPTRGPALHDGAIMAVCMRCYGVLLGLLATRLLYAAEGGASKLWLRHHGRRGLALFGALIFAYAAELAGQLAGLWRFDHLLMACAGAITGVGLGLMFHPALQER